MIRVVLAEDNLNLRRNLALRLNRAGDLKVVGEASTHAAAVQLARSRRAQVVLMDVVLGGSSGLDAIRTLTAPRRPDPVAVMILTASVVDSMVIEALDAGAMAYLVRGLDTGNLVGLVRAVARGERVVSTAVSGVVVAELVRRGRQLWAGPPPSVTGLLSPAELAVLRQLCAGATSNELAAARLGVSVNTVRTHLASCLRKLGLADRTQLALWGVQHGLGSPAPARLTAEA